MNRLPQRLSLVAQTAAVLKDEIQSGRWSKQLPGEHEICSTLHVGRVMLRLREHLAEENYLLCDHRLAAPRCPAALREQGLPGNQSSRGGRSGV